MKTPVIVTSFSPLSVEPQSPLSPSSPVTSIFENVMHVTRKTEWQPLPLENRGFGLKPPFASKRIDDKTIEIATEGELIRQGGTAAVYTATHKRLLKTGNKIHRECITPLVHRKEVRDTPDYLRQRSINNQQAAYDILGKKGYVAPPPILLGPHDSIQENLGSDLVDILLKKKIPAEKYQEPVHLNLKARLNILKQATEAVQQCHKAGIIHRDIKMDNFVAKVVKNEIQTRLIDFDDSLRFDEAPFNKHVMIRQFVDTPTQNQMPPTEATDIYGIGCLIAELLCMPFDFQYCRLYLEQEPQFLKNEIAKQLDRWISYVKPKPALLEAISKLNQLVARIFLADRELTLFALEKHLPYALYFSKKSPNKFFTDPDIYNTLLPVVKNYRKRYCEDIILDDESKAEAAFEHLNLEVIPGNGRWPNHLPQKYIDKMRQVYPSLEEIIQTLEEITENYCANS